MPANNSKGVLFAVEAISTGVPGKRDVVDRGVAQHRLAYGQPIGNAIRNASGNPIGHVPDETSYHGHLT
jgi:hypothetical protein